MARWLLVLLSVGMSGSVARATGPASALFQGKIAPTCCGTKVGFEPIDTQWLADRYTAIAEFTFMRNTPFSADIFQIGVNGFRARVPEGQMHRYARWEKRRKTWVLVVDIGRLNFDEGVAFAESVSRIQALNRKLRIWVSGCDRVEAAQLYFVVAADWFPTPFLSWVGGYPPQWVDTRIVDFDFKSSDPAARAQCQLDGGKPVACESHIRFSFLKNGWHTFRALLTAANGKRGHGLKHAFYVWYVPPAIEISQVLPSESPTPSDSVAFDLKQNWKFPGAEIQCQLDEQPFATCASPVTYHGLKEGDHAFKVRLAYRFSANHWWGSKPQVYQWTVERPALVVHWVSVPPALGNQTSSRFQFVANREATFQCSVDGASPDTCTSPLTLDKLLGESHTLQVVARDAYGSVSGALVYHWAVDLTPPQITLTSVLPQQNPTNLTQMTLSFTVSEPSTLQCLINGVAVSPCSSPWILTGLAAGANDLEIIATDLAGNVGPPVRHDWVIDLTAPTVTIQLVSPVALPTNQTTATFHLVASKTSTFQCTLDGGPEASCLPDFQLTGLSSTVHALAVTPTDLAGNTGLEQTFTWTVDTVPPVVTLLGAIPSDAVVATTSLSLAFGVSKPATTTCELDLAGAVACVSPWITNGLADGQHQITVRATDAAGNVATPVSYQWKVSTVVVDPTPPVVQITATAPASNPTSLTSMSLSFSSTNAVRYTCQLDVGTAQSCTSPAQWSGLGNGSHTVLVVGTSKAGNVSAPVQYTWNVMSAPLAVVSVSVQQVTKTTALVRWSSDFPAMGTVTYGIGRFNQTAGQVSPSSYNQSVLLSGLVANNVYQAQVSIVDTDGRSAVSTPVTFATLR